MPTNLVQQVPAEPFGGSFRKLPPVSQQGIIPCQTPSTYTYLPILPAPSLVGEGIIELLELPLVHFSSELRQRINELRSLRGDWNGEGAKPVHLRFLQKAIRELIVLSVGTSDFKEPCLVPTIEGFVQLEWHNRKRSLEFESSEQGWSIYGTLTGVDGRRQYFDSECEWGDSGGLKSAYEWFAGKELLWPFA